MTKDTKLPPFMEEAMESFKKFNVPGADLEGLMGIYKKNLELMNATQQIAIEATNEIMDLQRSYLQKAFQQWNEQVKATDSVDQKTSAATKKTKDAVGETLEHIKEINTVVAKSSEKINESFQKRLKESLDEASKLAKKDKDKK